MSRPDVHTLRKRFRRHYGAGPLQLLSVLACLALVGYVVSRVHAEGDDWLKIAAWFVGALVVNDLVLWPLYALADSSAIRLARRSPDGLPAVPWINYVRVPAVISGVLLGISFPLVLRISQPTYLAYTGLTEERYLSHWLLITGILFAGSAIIYAIRLRRVVRLRRHSAHTGAISASGNPPNPSDIG
jgi:hypothetical protein